MKRQRAFEAFLLKKKLPLKYSGYCEKIEAAFGGKDMDEIITSCQCIATARDKLTVLSSNTNSVNQYMTGLNWYLKFAFSAAAPCAVPSAGTADAPLYHVARAKGVELTKEVASVAQTLEQEYAHVVQFAKDVLVEGSFDYIPVIISNETPIHDSPDGDGRVLGMFFPSEKPHIEIYYRNGDPNDPAQFRKCLAHEYLHYLHFAFAGTEFGNANKELKEALADFFGVLYAINRHGKDDLTIARIRYDRWKKNFGTYWPYANALHFYRAYDSEMAYSSVFEDYAIHGSIGKFVQVFFCTDRPDEAYRRLLG